MQSHAMQVKCILSVALFFLQISTNKYNLLADGRTVLMTGLHVTSVDQIMHSLT